MRCMIPTILLGISFLPGCCTVTLERPCSLKQTRCCKVGISDVANPTLMIPERVVSESDVLVNPIGSRLAMGWGRVQNRAAISRAWLHSKLHPPAEAPQPRFHPVPVRPVFQPQEPSTSYQAALYGEFGTQPQANH